MLKKIWIGYLFLCLSSCATVNTPSSPAQNQFIPWETRVQTLSHIEQWNLKGLIAIRTQQDAGSADIAWQQNHKNYTFSLFGPLGTQSFKLQGQPGSVLLEIGNGKIFKATNPEILLAQQTGWKLPVSYLYYWIRGLPVPGLAAQKQFDIYHHLISLKQAGWTIHYLRYTAVNDVDLPSKVFLEHSPLSVKLIISDWKI